MKAPNTPRMPNAHDSRESWLRAGADELRPYFSECGYPLPDRIRYAIAFTSTGRKSKRYGECWHSSASDDSAYEIFIRADLADPLDVLCILVKELVHTALPTGSGHGKLFKSAAARIGLQGPMRSARPGVLLKSRLVDVAAALGPLPHARLNVDHSPLTAVCVAIDRPKKQRTRMLKAECLCESCGYTVRVASKWAQDPGPPHCPKHGAMTVEFPLEIGPDITAVAELQDAV